jgi:hypothetical protein
MMLLAKDVVDHSWKIRKRASTRRNFRIGEVENDVGLALTDMNQNEAYFATASAAALSRTLGSRSITNTFNRPRRCHCKAPIGVW